MLVISPHRRINIEVVEKLAAVSGILSGNNINRGQHLARSKRDVGEIPYGRWYNVQTAFQNDNSPLYCRHEFIPTATKYTPEAALKGPAADADGIWLCDRSQRYPSHGRRCHQNNRRPHPHYLPNPSKPLTFRRVTPPAT